MSCNPFNDNNKGASSGGGGGSGSPSYGLLTLATEYPGSFLGEAFNFSSSPTELTPVVDLTYTLSADVVDFDQPSDGRLRYTGSETKTFLITCKYYVSDFGSYAVELRKNGALIDSGNNTVCYQSEGNSPEVRNAIVSLAQNDYLSMFAVRSVASTQDVSHASISAFSVT